MKNRKPYSCVADIYSHMMSFIDYKKWSQYYYLLTKDFIPSDARVLELAAGNCSLAAYLKLYYKNIFASDFSVEMMRKNNDPGLKKICCNMLQLPFKKKFKLIFSAFDSLNYLLTKKALTKLFNEVKYILEDDGIFSFDVSLENNSKKYIRYLNRKRTFNGIRYIQKSFYNKQNRIHTNKFLIKYPDGAEAEEIHQQKIFPMEVYFDLLTKSGFYVRNCFDAFTLEDASEQSQRIQFIALKSKKNADN
jgi:SAM-dependent methyltransferase